MRNFVIWPGFTPARVIFPSLDDLLASGKTDWGSTPCPPPLVGLVAPCLAAFFWGAPIGPGPFNPNAASPSVPTTWDQAFLASQASNFFVHVNHSYFGFFAQDQYKVTPKLTVNYGLRYDVEAGLDFFVNGDHNNFAPRVGAAWDMFGNGKTVIRAGAGLYYEQGSYDALMAIGNLLGLRAVPTGVNLYTNGNTTPTTAGGTIALGAITFSGGALGSTSKPGTVKYNWANNGPNTPIYSASPACGDGSVTLPSGLTPQPCNILGADPNLRTPYVTKWSVDLQQAITKDLSLDIAYVGNHASKLLGVMAAGRAILTICSPDCEMAQMILEHHLGWVVTNGDIEGGRRALLEAFADRARVAEMGVNAARLLRERFTLARAADAYY
ncbi:MAG: TonB-dependent receptor domain-containing protein, partial [Terriglobales bacterium]